MLLIFSKVLSVFIYIAVGLIANRLKVLPEESAKYFISFIMGITVPCLMISSITAQENKNSKLMAEAVAVTTLLSVITLPVWIMIISYLYL